MSDPISRKEYREDITSLHKRISDKETVAEAAREKINEKLDRLIQGQSNLNHVASQFEDLKKKSMTSKVTTKHGKAGRLAGRFWFLPAGLAQLLKW